MELLDDLIDQRALRLRHLAAMRVIETVAGAEERVSLLAAVVAPSRALLEASRAEAIAQLRAERAA